MAFNARTPATLFGSVANCIKYNKMNAYWILISYTYHNKRSVIAL